MEKKQNSKQLTVDEQIEVIWKENPKIPFMQSKDILGFGYKKGIAHVANKMCDTIEKTIDSQEKKKQINENNESFTGTTKELINHTNKKLAKENQKSESDIKYELDKAKKEILGDLCTYMKQTKDFLQAYQYTKEKFNKYAESVYFYEKNNGIR